MRKVHQGAVLALMVAGRLVPLAAARIDTVRALSFVHGPWVPGGADISALRCAPRALGKERSSSACRGSEGLRMLESNERGGGLGPLKGAGEFFGGLFQRKPKSKADAAIDAVLKDAPLPVKMMGGLFKGVANMAGEAMRDAADDLDRVSDVTIRAVSFDPQAREVLGEDVSTGMPSSQSFSSISVNGVARKRIALQMPIAGTRGSGTVRVDAAVTGDEVVLNSCSLDVNGKTIQVSGGDGGAGSGDGGSKVIDVDGVIDVDPS